MYTCFIRSSTTDVHTFLACRVLFAGKLAVVRLQHVFKVATVYALLSLTGALPREFLTLATRWVEGAARVLVSRCIGVREATGSTCLALL